MIVYNLLDIVKFIGQLDVRIFRHYFLPVVFIRRKTLSDEEYNYRVEKEWLDAQYNILLPNGKRFNEQ